MRCNQLRRGLYNKMGNTLEAQIEKLKELGDFIRVQEEVISRMKEIDRDAFSFYRTLYEQLPSLRAEVCNGDYNTRMVDKILSCYKQTVEHYAEKRN